MASQDIATDINIVGKFLANEQVQDLPCHPPVECIVICISSVLWQAEELFRILERHPTLTKALVLVGGIGHSTQAVYDAVNQHEKFSAVGEQIRGLPESRVVEVLLRKYFDYEKITKAGCRILIEDKSTNCGSNATETRELLNSAGIPVPESCIIIQDITMSLRTLASFQKAYEHDANPPKFSCCPLLVPRMTGSWPELEYDVPGIRSSSLWPKKRFYELLVGEIPRLRNDEHGYGPKGKGFITHVHVPAEVEQSWQRLRDMLQVAQR